MSTVAPTRRPFQHGVEVVAARELEELRAVAPFAASYGRVMRGRTLAQFQEQREDVLRDGLGCVCGNVRDADAARLGGLDVDVVVAGGDDRAHLGRLQTGLFERPA